MNAKSAELGYGPTCHKKHKKELADSEFEKMQITIFDILDEKKEFTYASAFAGIGGMTMGLEQLGGRGVIAWEYDPTSKRQYAHEAHRLLHPHIPVEGDICEVDTSEIPDFDVFCFTPPCQAFSVAGKRGGFEDTRGTLTFEALRIAKDKQPKVLFMENVKGLVNHDKGNTLGVIIAAINDIGYTLDWMVLNSKYFDVAQNRERIYLVAIRNDLITPEPWVDVKGNTMLPKAKKRYQAEGAKTFNFDWPEQTEVRTRLRDFLEENVNEKYCLSEDKTTALIKQLESKDFRKLAVNDSPKMLGLLDILGNEQIRRVYSPDGQAPTLTTMQGGQQEPKIVEEMLTDIDRHSVVIGEYPKYRIRKLTPRECLRLQSVSEENIDKLLENFSDSRCYKFAGNGLTTNVIKAIGEKILKYI